MLEDLVLIIQASSCEKKKSELLVLAAVPVQEVIILLVIHYTFANYDSSERFASLCLKFISLQSNIECTKKQCCV